MPLNHTLTASCDHSGCKAEIALNPNTTQPFLDISDHHWVSASVKGGTLTFCPSHIEDAR